MGCREMSPRGQQELKFVLSEESFAQIQTSLILNKQRLQFRFIEQAKCIGVYAIWWKHRCLYVGKSEDGTIYNRLCNHIAACHNDNLRRWVKYKNGELRFSFVEISEAVEGLISQVETKLISSLGAELNIQHKTK